MEHNFEICKTLSKKVYDDNMQENIDGWQMLKLEGQGTGTNETKKINVFRELNFACAAFRKGNEIIIAFRGTNGKVDYITDLSFVIKKLPSVTTRFARSFYDKIKARYKDCKISFTGHSLGGGYAQILSAQLVKDNDLCSAITFNAPGTGYILNKQEKEKYKNELNALVSNYVIMNDFVGNFREHIGSTYYIQPFPLDRFQKDHPTKKETSHGCILSYDEIEFGPHFNHPAGFRSLEAWALWIYDVNNTNPDDKNIREFLGLKVKDQYLKNAKLIIENPRNNIKLINSFKYKTEKQEYELLKNDLVKTA